MRPRERNPVRARIVRFRHKAKALEESGVQFFTVDEASALKSEIERLKGEIQFLKDLIADENKDGGKNDEHTSTTASVHTAKAES